jgi:ATP-binding cassette, subfamily C, bacterial LapB
MNDTRSSLAEQYFALTRHLAAHFSRPFARSAVERGLPALSDAPGISVLSGMLAAIGLKSAGMIRDVTKIDPITLPCILFRENGEPLLLVSISADRARFSFLAFRGNRGPHETSPTALRKLVTRSVMLVTRDEEQTAGRRSHAGFNEARQRPHWFWKPVRDNRGAWLQILIAAVGINLFGLALPIFVMNVYDRVIPNLAMTTLWTLVFGVAIALLLDLALKVIRATVLDRAGRRVDLLTSAALFRHAMSIRLSDRQVGAAALASQIRDFEAVREFFTSSSFIAVIDLMFIGLFIFVLWLVVGPIAFVALAAVPVVIVLALIAQVPMRRSTEQIQRLSERRHLVLIESLMGLETIKSLNGEPVVQREWEDAVISNAQVSGRSRFWSAFVANSTMFVQQAVSIVIIVWGVYLVAAGQITIGGLIAANILAGRVLAPLGNISQTLLRAQQSLRSFAAIARMMNQPGEAPAVVESAMSVQKGEIGFRNVVVTYPGAKLPALNDVNMTIAAGEAVGVLGRVGSGKSTLGKLLGGLVSPTSGLVLVDGYEIGQYDPAMLRDGIGYLPQDPEIFTGTILDNLLLGRPTAGEDEIRRALYLAGMDYFIAQNPDGLNQFVGEKGSRLSGGQRQAIAIARLLLRRPKLIYLDEPTNAMDHATEATVIRRLKELHGEGVTLVVATHRHSVAAIVDRLIVVENGAIAMDGRRDEVLARLSRAVPASNAAE